MENKLVHVTLTNFLIVSFVVTSSPTVDMYCTISEQYNQTLPDKLSNSDWTQYFDSAPKNPLAKKNRLNFTYTYDNTTSSWLYVRCGLSIQLKTAFFYGQIRTGFYYPTIPEINLILETVSYDSVNDLNTQKTDYLFRFNYNPSNKITLRVSQANQVSDTNRNKLYIKNLTIHQDYIKSDVQFQYFSFHKFISTSSDFPELIYMIGFDNLASASTNKWSTDGWDFTTTNPTKITTTMTVMNSGTFNLSQHIKLIAVDTPSAPYPKTFRRLPLQENKNVMYTSPDLNSPVSTSPNILPLTASPPTLFVYEDNKAYSCASGKYLSKLYYFYIIIII